MHSLSSPNLSRVRLFTPRTLSADSATWCGQALQVAAGNFALAAGHDLPTLGFAVVRRRTDGAGGFLLGVSLGIAVTATVV